MTIISIYFFTYLLDSIMGWSVTGWEGFEPDGRFLQGWLEKNLVRVFIIVGWEQG